MGKGERMRKECLRFEDNNSLMCEFPGSVESNLCGAKWRWRQLNASYEGKKGVHTGHGGLLSGSQVPHLLLTFMAVGEPD